MNWDHGICIKHSIALPPWKTITTIKRKLLAKSHSHVYFRSLYITAHDHTLIAVPSIVYLHENVYPDVYVCVCIRLLSLFFTHFIQMEILFDWSVRQSRQQQQQQWKHFLRSLCLRSNYYENFRWKYEIHDVIFRHTHESISFSICVCMCVCVCMCTIYIWRTNFRSSDWLKYGLDIGINITLKPPLNHCTFLMKFCYHLYATKIIFLRISMCIQFVNRSHDWILHLLFAYVIYSISS